MKNINQEKGINISEPRWPIDDSLPPLYANHFSITQTPHEIVVVFGNFIPTGLAKRSDTEMGKYFETATIKPLSKIVLSKAGFKALFAIMKDQMENLESAEEGAE